MSGMNTNVAFVSRCVGTSPVISAVLEQFMRAVMEPLLTAAMEQKTHGVQRAAEPRTTRRIRDAWMGVTHLEAARF